MSNKLEIVALNPNEIEQITENDIQTKEFFITYKQVSIMEKQVKEYKGMLTNKVQSLMVDRLNRALENGFTNGNIANQYGKVTYILGKFDEEEYFDMDLFKFENPELYKKYIKRRIKETKDSIRITPNKEL